MDGIISSIENHGTIVRVWVQGERASVPVDFDHRMFTHMVEGRGGFDRVQGASVTVDERAPVPVLYFTEE